MGKLRPVKVVLVICTRNYLENQYSIKLIGVACCEARIPFIYYGQRRRVVAAR
jgi:hypothetical protein